MKSTGFSILEILVAVMVASLIVVISTNLLNSIWNSTAYANSQKQKIETELMLRILRADIENASKKRDGRKNIEISHSDDVIELNIKRPSLDPSNSRLQLETMHWIFSKDTLGRAVRRNQKPLSIYLPNIKPEIIQISQNVHILKLRGENFYIQQVIDGR